MVDVQDWTKVVLAKTWTLGEIIAKGGFGAVYEASGPHHEPVVAKLIGKTPATDRELLFVDLAGMPNIIPVIDSGEHEDHFVIVMPRASHSLRDTRTEIAGPIPVEDTLPILRDLATALQARTSRCRLSPRRSTYRASKARPSILATGDSVSFRLVGIANALSISDHEAHDRPRSTMRIAW